MNRDQYLPCAVAILFAILIVGLVGACEDSAAPGSPANRPPILNVPSDMSVAYGDTLRLNVSATDPDGDSLTYSMAVLASLSEITTGYFAYTGFNKTTGAFWFFPGPRDVPSRSFRFGAEDDGGGTATAILKVTVVTRSFPAEE